MGDLRKQIRFLGGQVEGFLLVVRDFNQRLIVLEKKVIEIEKLLDALSKP